MSTGDGRRFVVYRETVVEPPGADSQEARAVAVFRFHLRFVPRPIRPIAIRVFEPLSILATPSFAGLPGFRTKLWLFDHGTGDYMGVDGWETTEHAERYARELRRLMARISVPGSVAYEVVEETPLSEYVTARAARNRRNRGQVQPR